MINQGKLTTLSGLCNDTVESFSYLGYFVPQKKRFENIKNHSFSTRQSFDKLYNHKNDFQKQGSITGKLPSQYYHV